MGEESFRQFVSKAPLRKKVYIFALGVAGVITIFLAGMSISSILQFDRSHEKKIIAIEEEKKLLEGYLKPEKAPEFTHLYQLTSISIPLVNRNATQIKYAQFTLKMDCPTVEAKEVMILNRAQILDSLYEVASRFYIEDFDKPEGLNKFKESLMQAYFARFKKNAPRKILLINWLVG